jgi:transketolase
VLIGTGAEVAVALAAADTLEADGIATRVVSMPSWELFEEQDETYRAGVLGGDVPRVSVEAAATFGWSRWADSWVGIDRFGASAPGATALDGLGINPGNVVDHARALLA